MNALRFVIRAIWFIGELLGFACDFAWRCLRHGGALSQAERSRWLQRSSRRTLKVFSLVTSSKGAPPTAGLLVSNHLTYLDILVLVSLMPAVFVAKSEVRSWPVFGWFASLAGTLFVVRAKRSDVSRMNGEIERTLNGGDVLVLFPEGTSWNGSEVLPFKSSLLEPIVGSKHLLTVAHIGYSLADGDVANDICYWGDMTFFPHLLKLLTKRRIEAHVCFAPVQNPASDRKELAAQLHAEVVKFQK
ncbi:MAG: 1-acyl-sn-glycerol-3-phosphate acyltransferase [Verrucomicrobia bacterium]|jgi:1-acyl-sn-glycerol-3-phosphate acyltransferase|nr:MAG: 1-acyl-sn-glycerol-3-phosphate acyltransferase [Verrucomicrobiota bacterium]